MKKKIFIFSDSVIACPNLNVKFKCIKILSKKIKTFKIAHKGIVGATSRVALENLEKYVLRRKIDYAIFQFGMNDSWYFKSLKGLPNVSEKSFETNLIEIILKCKKFNIKKIFFLNYHKVLKNRKEINRKSVNQNLKKFNYIIKSVSKNKTGVALIDVNKLTSKFSSKSLCLPEPDGVHLSRSGAEVYAKIIFNYLEKVK